MQTVEANKPRVRVEVSTPRIKQARTTSTIAQELRHDALKNVQLLSVERLLSNY